MKIKFTNEEKIQAEGPYLSDYYATYDDLLDCCEICESCNYTRYIFKEPEGMISSYNLSTDLSSVHLSSNGLNEITLHNRINNPNIDDLYHLPFTYLIKVLVGLNLIAQYRNRNV